MSHLNCGLQHSYITVFLTDFFFCSGCLGQDLQSSPAVSRYRGELGSEGRHEMCGSGMRGNRAAALTSTLDSPGSDDLLVDNEEGMLGKVSILSFYLLCHIFFLICITVSFDPGKKVLWILADTLLYCRIISQVVEIIHTI